MPKKSTKKEKKVTVKARVTEATAAALEEICALRGWSQSEALRQSIACLHGVVTNGPDEVEVDFEGDAETVAKKHQAIELFRRRMGPAMAARQVGVTLSEVERWLETDELFAEFHRWAQAETLETAEHAMYVDGIENGKLSARFGLLNSYSDKWGWPKAAYLRKEFLDFLDRTLLPALKQVLSPAQLAELAGFFRKLPERHLRKKPAAPRGKLGK